MALISPRRATYFLDSLRSPFGPACGCYFASLRLLVQRKLGKETHPGILRRSTSCIHAVVPPVLFRGSSRRAIHGPSFLIWHPCQMPLCTAPALGLLTGTARLPNRLPRVENAACGFSTGLPHGGQRYAVDHPTFQNARTGSPVRRVSGVGVDGVGSHGCDESCAGTWTAHRSGPLERRRSERTRNAAKRNTRPDAGSAFSLFAFSLRKQRESKTPCWRNL